MSTRQENEFNEIVKEIINNSHFKELDNAIHHGITRYGHSMRVARAAYKTTKALKMDYKSATRAAMLHDFFTEEDLGIVTNRGRIYNHPLIAAENAKANFEINAKEENIITSHMFPLSSTMPKYAESWVVSGIDKAVALVEGYRFRFYAQICVIAIFLFNMITIQK